MNHRYRSVHSSGEQDSEFKSISFENLPLRPLNSISLFKQTLIKLVLKSLLENFQDPFIIWYLFMTALGNSSYSPSISLRIFIILPFFLLLLIKTLKILICFGKQLKYQKRLNFAGVAIFTESEFVIKDSMILAEADFFIIKKNEVCPCDCFLMFVDAEDDSCLIRKQDLDDSGDLERRVAVKETQEVVEREGLNVKVLKECIENLQVRKEDTGDDWVKGVIEMKDHQELIQVTGQNYIRAGDIVLDCDWILCIAVRVGSDSSRWAGYDLDISKFKGPQAYIITVHNYIYITFTAILIALTILINQHSSYMGKDTLTESVFYSIFLYGYSLSISFSLIFEIEEVINYLLFNYKTSDIKISNFSSLSKLSSIEYVIADKIGVLTKRKIKVHLCLVSNTIYQDSIPDTQYEPCQISFSQSSDLLNSIITLRTFSELRSELSSQTYISKKWIFSVSLSLCNTFKSKTSIEVADSLDKSILNFSKEIGLELVSRLNKTFTLSFLQVDYNFTILISERLENGSIQISIIKDETSNQHYLITKTIKNISKNSIFPINFSYASIDKKFPNLSKLYYFYCELTVEEVKSIIFDYDEAKKSSINQIQRIASVFNLFIKRCKLLGVVGFENVIGEQVKEAVEQVVAGGVKFWISSSTSEESVLATGFQLGIVQERSAVLHLGSFVTNAELYQKMSVILDALKNDGGFTRIDSEFRRETEITSRFLENPKPDFAHPLLFDLGLLSKKLKIPKKLILSHKYTLIISSSVINQVSESKEMMKVFIYLIFCADSCLFHNMESKHKYLLVRILQNELSFKPKVLSIGSCDGSCKVIAEADIGVKLIDEKNLNTFYSDVSVNSFEGLSEIFKFSLNVTSVQYRFIEKIYFFRVILIMLTSFLFQFLCDFSACAVIDYDLMLVIDQVLALVLIVGFSYCIDVDKLNKRESLRGFNWSLVGTGILAGVNSVIAVLFVRQAFKDKLVDFGFVGLELFIILNLMVFVQVFFYRFIYKRLLILVFVYLVLMIIIISSIFHLDLGKYELLSESVFNSSGFWLNIVLCCGTCFVLSFVFNNFFISLDRKSLKPRIEEFKEKFHLIFADRLNWKFMHSWTSFRINKWKMQFVERRLENEYKSQVFENVRFTLKVYLICFLFLQIMNNLMEVAGKAVFLKIGYYSIFIGGFIFVLLLGSIFARPAYVIYIENLLFCLLLALSILKAIINNAISSIPRYPIYIIIFVLDLNINWYFTIGKASLLYIASIFTIVYEAYYTKKSHLAAEATTWTIIMFFTTILILFTSYLKDYYKRKEFNFINKLTQEVEKSSEVLLYLLPEFVKVNTKEGANYIAEDKGTISVIYGFIVEFDQIIKECDLEELGSMLNELNEQIEFICDSCGVTKVQSTGKYFVACAGIKDSEEFMEASVLRVNHSRRAVEMALAIIRESEKWVLSNGKKITFKIGIDVGPVIAGVVGYRKLQFTIIGNTFKTAKHLAKSLIEKDAVHISPVCYDHLPSSKGLTFKDNRVDLKQKGTLQSKIVCYPSLNYDLDSLDDVYIKFIRRKSSIANRSFSSNRLNDQISAEETQQVKRLTKTFTSRSPTRLSVKLNSENLKISHQAKLNIENFWKTSDKDRSYFNEYSNEIKHVQVSGLLISLICDFLLIVAELGLALNQVVCSSYARLVAVLAGEVMMAIAYFMKKRYVRQRSFGFVASAIYLVQFFLVFFSSLATRDINLVYLMYYFYKYLLLCFFTGTIFKQNIYFHVPFILAWIFDLFRNYPDYQFIVYTFGYFTCNLSLIYRQETNLRVNQMLKSQAKQQYSKTQASLQQILPPSISTPSEKPSQVKTLNQVTLISLHLQNFCTWSSNKSPSEVLTLLSNLFNQFDKLCASHSIYKLSTEQENYYAMSYLNDNKRDLNKEAVSSALFSLNMIEIVSKMSEKIEFELKAVVVLHCDDVLAAVVGEKVVRFEVFGETVEICRKMRRAVERKGFENGVFCSRSCKEMAEGGSGYGEIEIDSEGIRLDGVDAECFWIRNKGV